MHYLGEQIRTIIFTQVDGPEDPNLRMDRPLPVIPVISNGQDRELVSKDLFMESFNDQIFLRYMKILALIREEIALILDGIDQDLHKCDTKALISS